MTKGDYMLLAILFVCITLLTILMARGNVHLRRAEKRIQRVERQHEDFCDDVREEHARLQREIDQLVYKVYGEKEW